jgi:hypothetical protein
MSLFGPRIAYFRREPVYMGLEAVVLPTSEDTDGHQIRNEGS